MAHTEPSLSYKLFWIKTLIGGWTRIPTSNLTFSEGTRAHFSFICLQRLCVLCLWFCFRVVLFSVFYFFCFTNIIRDLYTQRRNCTCSLLKSTVPLKSKLPPSRETRFSSRDTRLSSRERLKNTVSTNACRSHEIKTSVVKLRARCQEASWIHRVPSIGSPSIAEVIEN